MKAIIKSIWLVILLPLSLNSYCQTVNAFSVHQAVDYAMINAIQVKNALIDIKIQQQTNREITSAALPRINGSAQLIDYIDIPVSLVPAEFFGGAAGTFAPVRFGTKYNAGGGIDFTQLLFEGQVFVGLKARNTSIKFYETQAAITKEQINVNVQKIYYQLVVGKKQMTSIDANIERFEKLLKDTREIYKNGFAERLDVDKVNVQLNNLITEKVRLQNQLDAGLAALKFLMNMPQKDSLVLTDTISEELLKSDLLDAKYEYKNRKEYQLLNQALKLGKYNIQRFRLSYIPTIAAFGSFNKNAQRSSFSFLKDGAWFTTSLVGIKMQIPIFDGFAKQANIRKAQLEYEKTRNAVEQLENAIDQDVYVARTKILSAVATIDNQRRNMQLAEQVYYTTKKKYEQGLGSNQEIYNAQAELKVAQNNYYAAMYDAIIAKIDYLKATGTL